MKGIIKTISKERGFGFIRNENDKDVFFHLSNLVNEKFQNLREGDNVEFKLENGTKGVRAIDIWIVKDDDNNDESTMNPLEKLKNFFSRK